ncbi:MAG: winged helix-turn-helix domain-containing protein [Chloroflexi bacterium]|nr:winged helix-turn-helix domain-containing protein [Chloroflexota bacterium]
MKKRAIYMSNGSGTDVAIQRGLNEAGCEVICTQGIAETLSHLGMAGIKINAEPTTQSMDASNLLVLVADVQAGAIPLLTLLKEQGVVLPPTLVFDRDGSDIRVAIKALQLGVRDYLLASDPEINRELCACVLAERESKTAGYSQAVSKLVPRTGKSVEEFEWDPITYVIRIGDEHLHLSPIEGRIFDLLYARRGQVVTVKDFVIHALKKPELDSVTAARQLRPHLMRLRRKLGHYPLIANRIVNTRGAGYMLV